ncbi:MAG TPA: serine/threonine-protein kinase [Acidimicrobiia bacterium]|nr:serine/threonine-protein kinase [Acidimicrobiia bacterium]
MTRPRFPSSTALGLALASASVAFLVPVRRPWVRDPYTLLLLLPALFVAWRLLVGYVLPRALAVAAGLVAVGVCLVAIDVRWLEGRWTGWPAFLVPIAVLVVAGLVPRRDSPAVAVAVPPPHAPHAVPSWADVRRVETEAVHARMDADDARRRYAAAEAARARLEQQLKTVNDSRVLRGSNDVWRLDEPVPVGGGPRVVFGVSADGRREAAAKVIRVGAVADERLARFVTREFETACRLSGHSAVIEVYDCGSDRNAMFLVMRRHRQGSLHDWLRRNDTFPLTRYVDYMLDVLSALEHLDACYPGSAHRDLKPSNVLMTDDASHVVTADWGSAHLPEADLATRTGAPATPCYAAPEQLGARGGITPATDLWAVGAMLREALTGRPLHWADVQAATGDRRLEHYRRLLATPLAPILDLNPGAPAALAEYVDGCLLQGDPRDRPPSAAAARQQLTEIRSTLDAAYLVPFRALQHATDAPRARQPARRHEDVPATERQEG